MAMTAKVLGDVYSRMNQTRDLAVLGAQQRRLAMSLLWTSAMAIMLMMVSLEMRVNGVSNEAIDIVKIAGV
eukprot:6395774-Prymnesium_polylepis.1